MEYLIVCLLCGLTGDNREKGSRSEVFWYVLGSVYGILFIYQILQKWLA